MTQASLLDSRSSECGKRERPCKKCGTAFVPSISEEKRHLHPERMYEFCGQCLGKHKRAHLAAELARRGVPPRYQRCCFESFDLYDERLRLKVEALKRLGTEQGSRGAYVFGPVGAGKTYLATALLGELIIREYCAGKDGDHRRGFTRAIDFVLQCQQVFRNEETIEGIVWNLLEGDFLVLDDLGAEKTTDFVRMALLYLVDEAYCQEKRLIVTSNLSLDDLNAFEPRIASRLAEMCDVFHLDVPDYRVRSAAQRRPG